MTNINKAREYARWLTDRNPEREDARAAAEVIQSLPDRWIDAEKVREIYDRYRANELNLHEAFRAAVALTTPPLPTLADMTPEERERCQWRQADVKLANGGSATCVIANPRMPGAKVRVWAPHGGSDDVEEGRVTPLPDLPKLEWPGDGVVDAEIVDSEPTLPRPEDVPAGEPWIVQHEGVEGVGCRNEPESSLPWLLIRRDEHQFDYCYDTDITLVSRLVPEVAGE